MLQDVIAFIVIRSRTVCNAGLCYVLSCYSWFLIKIYSLIDFVYDEPILFRTPKISKVFVLLYRALLAFRSIVCPEDDIS